MKRIQKELLWESPEVPRASNWIIPTISPKNRRRFVDILEESLAASLENFWRINQGWQKGCPDFNVNSHCKLPQWLPSALINQIVSCMQIRLARAMSMTIITNHENKFAKKLRLNCFNYANNKKMRGISVSMQLQLEAASRASRTSGDVEEVRWRRGRPDNYFISRWIYFSSRRAALTKLDVFNDRSLPPVMQISRKFPRYFITLYSNA